MIYCSIKSSGISALHCIIGELELCPGESQTLVCSANYTFFEWSVITTSQPPLNEIRTVSYSALSSVVVLPIRVNTTNITFSKDSPRMALPLVSTMAIKVVSSHLNGSVISCTGKNGSSVFSVVLMKTIHTFDVNRGIGMSI